MGGRFSRNKGLRMERELVNLFLDAGISAERVPLSGAAGGSFSGDISFAAVPGKDWVGEVKARATGFARLYKLLDTNSTAHLTDDLGAPVAVLCSLIHFFAVRSEVVGALAGEIKTQMPTQITGWLGSNDALFLRRDRSPWLCVVPLDRWQELQK